MRSFEPMPIMNSELFYLRTIRKNDFLDLFEYGSDVSVTKYVSWGPMTTPSEAKWVIDHHYLPRDGKGMPIGYAIVYRENNKMIGTIDFHTIDFNNNIGEIGYVLNHHYQGKGIMTEALKLMVQVGFDVLNLNRIEIKHDTCNTASKRVIEKADFRFEGILRNRVYNNKQSRFVDICIYSILRNEYQRGELSWQLIK